MAGKIRMEKRKISTIILVTAVLVLLVLAAAIIYTIARRDAVPPASLPVIPQAVSGASPLNFSVNPPELTLSPTPVEESLLLSSPTGTATPSMTTPAAATSLLGCYEECDSDDNCETDWRCQSVSGVQRCVNLSCPGEKDCRCLLAEASPLTGLTPTPTGPTPTLVVLPEAGISLPTIGAILGGVVLTLIALALAL